MTGAWSPAVFADPDNRQAAIDYICAVMPDRMPVAGTRWTGEAIDAGLRFHWRRRGVVTTVDVPASLAESPIVDTLLQSLEAFERLYAAGASLHLGRAGDDVIVVRTPGELYDAIRGAGEHGVDEVKRFKGLGEMNPEELWKTTLDPEHRSILQVRVEDAAATDEILSVLMGDAVPPRKEFITNGAASVDDLDI